MSRKALAVVIACGSLLVAGAAGAVTTGTIAIKVGDTAKLNGSRVMCFVTRSPKGRPTIECGVADGKALVPGYSATVNDTGVYVWKNLPGGTYKKAAFYVNK